MSNNSKPQFKIPSSEPVKASESTLYEYDTEVFFTAASVDIIAKLIKNKLVSRTTDGWRLKEILKTSSAEGILIFERNYVRR